MLVVWRSGVLGVAIEAALRSLGWQTRSSGPGSEPPVDGWRERIIVVADEGGILPRLPRRALESAHPTIAVGLRRSIPSVANSVERGLVAVVVDGDQPYYGLIRSLHELLLTPPPATDRSLLLRRLRGREAEARRLSSLTARERHILWALSHGLSASEIAQSEYLSLTTVRSHIRAVLTKLDVRSQLAAVAMARRAAYPDRGVSDPGNFVNSDDAVRA